MNITFRQLRAFASIARHHSFSKAATELHLTQSSLSGLIKEMEKQLDTRLFDRTTRQIHLTESGERFCPMPIRCLTICNLCVMRSMIYKTFIKVKCVLQHPSNCQHSRYQG
ncbi:LysR family transcriptional regulator [Moraxella catarrhalis]|nr:LysR family transcriptional regulator [Moraxella catarrhalis]MCG6831315.1 LysR family transcriptional regulator [Moraxella catarrhalis]